MKKFLLLSLVFLSTSFAFAKDLTVSETLTAYFTDLLPNAYSEQDTIQPKYTDVSPTSPLFVPLQRAIYYGMMPNVATKLRPKSIMKDRFFAALLKKHFGVTIKVDNSNLTQEDYELFMRMIRPSYAYKLIHEINTHTETPVTNTSKISTITNYSLLDRVYTILREQHLANDTIRDQDLIYSAAEGLATGTGDPYTQYFRPQDATKFQNVLDGKTVGIGVILDVDAPDSLLVKEIIDEGPADRMWLQTGDHILSIDGVAVDTTDGVEDEINHLRGVENTTVSIVISSANVRKTLQITRAVVSIPIVTTQTTDTAFVIKYREVATNSDRDIQNALQDFLKSGKKRLIWDLRDNPGGGLQETSNILNFFLPKGHNLMILKFKNTSETFEAPLVPIIDWSSYEVVFLVNANTASAAEIITAVLHEYFTTTSVVIGTKTYGKGVVQDIADLGEWSLLKYTVAEWLTPGNQSINKIGIQPDHVVIFDQKKFKETGVDTQLQSAQTYRF